MIEVFVGSSEVYAEQEKVLQRSILANTTSDVSITFMRPGSELKACGCTGFTNYRWIVPDFATDYGIYLDVDMVVLGDIAELYAYRKPGKYVCMQDGSTEVMVMDSRVSITHPAEVHHQHKTTLMSWASPYLSRDIPPEWNVEDRTEPGMKLLHFTDLSMQPMLGLQHNDPDALAILEQYQC